MNYCSKCGTKLENGVCPNCGNAANVEVGRTQNNQQWNNAGQQYQTPSYELVCPRCGNKDLQMVTQSNVHTEGKDFSAGKGCLGFLLLGPLGLLCGMCGKGRQVGTTNIVSWICPKCGMTVDSQSSGGEIKKKNQLAIIIVVILILLLVWFALSLVMTYSSSVPIGTPLEYGVPAAAPAEPKSVIGL